MAINGVTKPLYGSQACADALRSLITATDRSHWMEQELNRVVSRSVGAQSFVAGALGSLAPLAAPFDSTNSLATQLQLVARMNTARGNLGVSRQVFFVSLGGFDMHDFLVAQHPGQLTLIDDALSSFYQATFGR